MHRIKKEYKNEEKNETKKLLLHYPRGDGDGVDARGVDASGVDGERGDGDGNDGKDGNGRSATPVAARPAKKKTVTKTRSRRMARRGGDAGGAVGEKGKGKKHETQEKCQGEKILDWRPRTIYVEHGYSVSLSTVRKEEDERGTDGTDNLFIRRHAYV
ncbi:hypothetical protein AK88_05310 [Plasmodium fragile]|uniref:Uncharacterized protein n=1 Tax=Plasmodium fragile TaxID=5857 RepID=A0A0D9QDB4_PLAFR|nr:uncharacterized protein AK88_05310 [Plasmodium fragile]KJP85055.1 hypothetical protein AK88_05310 [Plasmodium fragile]